jgi:archaeal flagellin FlaB
MGVGSLIVFIALVLVAGMAAYAVYQTAQQLETQSKVTGDQTINEVSTGVRISTVEGHQVSGSIDKLVMIVSPRPGSPEIDLAMMQIEISDTDKKCLLAFDPGSFADASMGTSDLFSEDAFPSTGGLFGVIVLKDDDDSCTAATPVLNRGDNVMLAVNTTACFNGIGESVTILGNVIPENGAWAIISFMTPSVFVDSVLILHQG